MDTVYTVDNPLRQMGRETCHREVGKRGLNWWGIGSHNGEAWTLSRSYTAVHFIKNNRYRMGKSWRLDLCHCSNAIYISGTVKQ